MSIPALIPSGEGKRRDETNKGLRQTMHVRGEAALVASEEGGRVLVGCHLAAMERTRTERGPNCVYSSFVRSLGNGQINRSLK